MRSGEGLPSEWRRSGEGGTVPLALHSSPAGPDARGEGGVDVDLDLDLAYTVSTVGWENECNGVELELDAGMKA